MAQPHSGHTLPPSLPGGPSDRPDTGRPTSGLSSLLQGAAPLPGPEQPWLPGPVPASPPQQYASLSDFPLRSPVPLC